jgi:hypothetical protein
MLKIITKFTAIKILLRDPKIRAVPEFVRHVARRVVRQSGPGLETAATDTTKQFLVPRVLKDVTAKTTRKINNIIILDELYSPF